RLDDALSLGDRLLDVPDLEGGPVRFDLSDLVPPNATLQELRAGIFAGRLYEVDPERFETLFGPLRALDECGTPHEIVINSDTMEIFLREFEDTGFSLPAGIRRWSHAQLAVTVDYLTDNLPFVGGRESSPKPLRGDFANFEFKDGYIQRVDEVINQAYRRLQRDEPELLAQIERPVAQGGQGVNVRAWLLAMAQAESGLDNSSVSEDNARSFLQFLPATAREMGVDLHDRVDVAVGAFLYGARRMPEVAHASPREGRTPFSIKQYTGDELVAKLSAGYNGGQRAVYWDSSFAARYQPEVANTLRETENQRHVAKVTALYHLFTAFGLPPSANGPT
ncbi:MAG: lytic transglycosylase domain-containing protein, partial [Myxococcota bacterium]